MIFSILAKLKKPKDLLNHQLCQQHMAQIVQYVHICSQRISLHGLDLLLLFISKFLAAFCYLKRVINTPSSGKEAYLPVYSNLQ